MLFFHFIHAIIPAKALQKAVYVVKPNYSYMDPVIGYAGWASGFIENLRFYGNFKPGSPIEGGTPNHAGDANEADPIWTLVRLLFPSTAPSNELNTTCNLSTNFGKIVVDPQIVAKLIKLAFCYRYAYYTPYAEPIIKNIKTDLIDSTKKKPKEIDSIVDPILENIKIGITKELELSYPKYTVEQILLTFLWVHFDEYIQDGQSTLDVFYQEFREPLNGLKFTIKDIAYNPFIQSIRVFVEQLNVQVGLTPFHKRNFNPASNMPARFFRRAAASDTFFKNKAGQTTFQDCVEIALRHVCALLLWNPESLQYTFPDTCPENIKRVFDLLKDPNSTNIDSRSAWNAIVADLNPDNDASTLPPVLYGDVVNGKYSNNVLPGFLNSANVLIRIFNLQGPIIQQFNTLYSKVNAQTMPSFESIEKDLIELFKNVFQDINPLLDINMSLKGAGSIQDTIIQYQDRNTRDIFGSLAVTFSKKEDSHKINFSVSYMKGHGWVSNISDSTISASATTKLPKTALEGPFLTVAMLGDSYEKNDPWIQDTKSHILYRLFSRNIADSDSKMRYLRILNRYIYNNGQEKKPFPQTMSIQNIANTIGYDDPDTKEKAMSHVMTLHILMPSLPLKQNFSQETSCKIHNADVFIAPDNLIELSTGFAPLTLDLSRATQLQKLQANNATELDISHLKNLVDLTLDRSTLKQGTIMPSVRKLTASHQEGLDLSPFPNVTDLTLDRSTLKPKSSTPLVKKLTASYQENLDLSPFPSLTELALDHSTLKPDIKIPSVTKLTASHQEDLDLSPFPNVTDPILYRSTLKLGSSAPSVKKLEASYQENLDLSPLSSLTELTLDHSTLKLGTIIPSVRKLTASCQENLDLSPLSSLTELTLDHSTLKLDTIIPSVKKLEASHQENLDLSPLPSLTELTLSSGTTLKPDIVAASVTKLTTSGQKDLDLTPLSKLTELTLGFDTTLKQGATIPTSIAKLTISCLYNFDLTPFSKLTELNLELGSLAKDTPIPASITKLMVSGQWNFDLNPFPNLTELTLGSRTTLKQGATIPDSITKLTALDQKDIDLKPFPKLIELTLGSGTTLKQGATIPCSLTKLTALDQKDIDLNPFPNLTELTLGSGVTLKPGIVAASITKLTTSDQKDLDLTPFPKLIELTLEHGTTLKTGATIPASVRIFKADYDSVQGLFATQVPQRMQEAFTKAKAAQTDFEIVLPKTFQERLQDIQERLDEIGKRLSEIEAELNAIKIKLDDIADKLRALQKSLEP